MDKKTSPKLILGSLTLAAVLLMNPNAVFAGGPSVPVCDGSGGPEGHLVTGIGGIDPTTFDFTFVPDPDGGGPILPMIMLTEDWLSTARSYIVICGLTPGLDYQVKKIITNDSGDPWTSFDNELLDPDGDVEDATFPDQAKLPYVSIFPEFSHSNDSDGLSFSMSSGITRSSSVWSSHLADEFDKIDFLTFTTGTLNDGDTDNFMTYGLRTFDSPEVQQPFLLTQIPNFIRPPVGGNMIDIDTTAVLLAGAQMNAFWLLPLVAGTVAFGIVASRKLKN